MKEKLYKIFDLMSDDSIELGFFVFLILIGIIVYILGIDYFVKKGYPSESCVIWPLPILFIGAFLLPFIECLIEKISKKINQIIKSAIKK